MDPNPWNYNQAYSRISSGSLPASHGGINRLDFPLLDQATLSSGFGLSPSLSPHANLTSRSLGGLSGVNYPGHPLHTTMPQFLDPMAPLQASFSSQPTYKPMSMGQNPFPFDSPGRSSSEIPVTYSPARYTTGTPSLSAHTKSPLFSPQELTSPKDLATSFAASSQSLAAETSPKGWGLSNFLPTPTTPFGNISDALPSDFGLTLPQPQQTPPPAHSSGSRINPIQRNPYTADMLFAESTRPVKNPQPLHSPRDPSPFTSVSSSNYGRLSDAIQSPKTSLPGQTPHSYTASPPEIEDLSSHSQTHPIYSSYMSTSYNSIPSGNPVYSSSQLQQDMDYDPVSPATPLPEAPQPNDNPFTTVSLQDLAALGTAQSPVHEKPHQRETNRDNILSRESVLLHQESMLHASLEKSNRMSKESAHVQSLPSHMTMQHTSPGIHNGQNIQNAASPMQQSPISVGSPQIPMSVSSPQVAMPLGSPQSLMPSSTVVQAPPPVQAMADSTTKPKRGGRGSRGGRGVGGRARRKKDEENNSFMGEIQQPPIFANEIAQHQQAPRQPHPAYSDMGHTAYRSDSRQPEMNQTFLHSDMGVEPTLTPGLQRQMSAGQTEPMQRSPLEESLVSVQQQQQQQSIQDQMTHRTMTMSEDLLSRHSSMSSLNSGHQASPMQEALSMNHQPTYCDNMVSVQHSSPLTNPSPPNQMTVDSSHVVRNTDSSSMTSHSALSDSSIDQRGSVLSAVRETDAIMSGADQYNINGFVDTPFMDQLADTPQAVTQPMNYQQQGHMTMMDKNIMSPDMNNPNSFQDAMNNGMHMSQFGSTFQMPQEQHHLASLDMNAVSQAGSTIDEATFSSLFGSPHSSEKGRRRTKAEQKLMPIVTPKVDEDDELAHLALPPPAASDPISQGKEEVRGRKSFGSSFQDCFLNYLMGKKQETLESLSSATIHKKPQLPKYFPEPRRPRPPSPPKKDSKRSSGSSDEGSFSGVGFSDSDSSEESVAKTVQNVISQMSDDDSKDKVKKSKDLTIRISVPSLKKSPRSGRVRGAKATKARGSRGSKVKGKGGAEVVDGTHPAGEVPPAVEVPVIQPRERISRRAKEKALQKKKKVSKPGVTEPSDASSSSSSDDENIKSITKEESEKDYDSDKDPAWTPFEVDIRQPTYDDTMLDKPKRLRRISAKGRTQRSRNRSAGQRRPSDVPPDLTPAMSPPKVAKFSPLDTGSVTAGTLLSKTNSITSNQDSEDFMIGKFILEKKDMHNYESYPIWKIEQGRMIHKYEILSEDGNIRHKAVSTYSSWMPTMRDQFVPIKVKLISSRDAVEIVEVTEEYRPKPPTDGSLETKYEDDPLVDLFNVYLQIFLSQALEPGFLSAITDAQDNFYLSALEKIDKLIASKLEDIDKKIKWKPSFKASLKIKPQLREIDRPNLKQPCQACENSSPPTIKTVHFLGAPYDRFDMDDLPDPSDTCTEFMIGKTAAQYVGVYHSLHHFKYNLYKRCLAKVKLLRDSTKGIDNEKLLDQCLHNRAWVLKIFEDLKRMLEKG
ncbi:glutamine and serine-rich protein 1-like isoform X2 [Haliotis cracherodii]|uniref:glutamine and serine-rich protein 1-like isoform X2 n=1 Tax=Haliotis cracherodii TaxID=6455 RepID=UPI0039ED2617